MSPALPRRSRCAHPRSVPVCVRLHFRPDSAGGLRPSRRKGHPALFTPTDQMRRWDPRVSVGRDDRGPPWHPSATAAAEKVEAAYSHSGWPPQALEPVWTDKHAVPPHNDGKELHVHATSISRRSTRPRATRMGATLLVLAFSAVTARAQAPRSTVLPPPEEPFKGTIGRTYKGIDLGQTVHHQGPRRRSKRPLHPDRRRRLRPDRHLRRTDPYPRVGSPRPRRPALHPLSHHGAVLAHPAPRS